MNYLGRFLKKRLTELKMSEREISARCGISHSYLNQLIKGVNPGTRKNISPTLATFEKLAQGFGVSVEKLQMISRGIKESEIDRDFQELITEMGIDRFKENEEEWSELLLEIKKTIKKHLENREKVL